MSTVLSECGVTDEVVSTLREHGLTITANTRPFADAHVSPSAEWIVSAIDAFTPPLSDEERQLFIDRPEVFLSDLVYNLRLWRELCSHLLKCAKSLAVLPPERAVAGACSGLVVFQSATDNHYYKYDGQLEFLDTKDSPAGFYWIELSEICRTLASRLGVTDPDRWARERALAMLAAAGRNTASTRFLDWSVQTYDMLSACVANLDELDVGAILTIVEQRCPDMLRRLLYAAERYHRSPRELVGDALRSATSGVDKVLRRGRSESSGLEEASHVLSPEEIQRLTWTLSSLGVFQRAQEEEAFLVNGVMPEVGGRPFDAGLAMWDELRKKTKVGCTAFAGRYVDTVRDILDGEFYVGTRRLLGLLPVCLTRRARTLFCGELGRWL